MNCVFCSYPHTHKTTTKENFKFLHTPRYKHKVFSMWYDLVYYWNDLLAKNCWNGKIVRSCDWIKCSLQSFCCCSWFLLLRPSPCWLLLHQSWRISFATTYYCSTALNEQFIVVFSFFLSFDIFYCFVAINFYFFGSFFSLIQRILGIQIEVFFFSFSL